MPLAEEDERKWAVPVVITIVEEEDGYRHRAVRPVSLTPLLAVGVRLRPVLA